MMARHFMHLLDVFLIAGCSFAQPASPTGRPDLVIRTSTREVLLDLVVRDAHGKLVTNLKPEEIAVYEDGVRQDVRSFRLVAGSEVRIEDERQAAGMKAEAASPQAPLPPAGRPALNPLRTVNLVCLVLNDITASENNIGGTDLIAPTRTFAFKAAGKFIENELRPNTFIGIFTLDSSGLRPVYPFSNDRERLLKAAQLAAANQLPPITVGSAAMLNGLSLSMGVNVIGDTGSGNDPLGSRADMRVAAVGGLRELDALKGLVRQLGRMPFQKTVLLLSSGLARPPDQLEYWDSLINAATAGGVTFYTVDVHALDPFYDPTALSSATLSYAASLSAQQGAASQERLITPEGQIGPLGPPTLTQRTMELAHQDDYVKFAVSGANQQEALRELAERTGGFLIANTNNVDHLLARVMEDVDTHYEIAYPPSSTNEDGHFRKIDVKLARAGLTAHTRGGYFAVPETGKGPVTPQEMAGLRALDTKPRPHDFDFLLRTWRFREGGGTAQYAIAFEMPIFNLTATPQAGAGRHLFHASLLALVKNAQGQIVERVSKDVPSEVSDDRLAAVKVELMTYAKAVNLPPGQYTVEAAVVDEQGHRAATGVARIDNRERTVPGISDLMLVRRLENRAGQPDAADPFEFTGKRVLPFVMTDLYAGSLPFLYFVVYPKSGNAARSQMRVRFLQEGRVVAARRVTLSAPDSSGAVPYVIGGPDRPGSYEVKVTVVQGRESAERTFHYTVASK